MVSIFREFFSIKGRLNRKKYIIYWLCASICPLVILFTSYSIDIYIAKLVSGLCLFLGLIAHICIAIRRLHDVNRHGLTVVVLLIPVFSLFLHLYLFTTKGTEGYNFYGADPLESINY